MQYDILKNKHRKVTQLYPELQAYEEFHAKNSDEDALVRFAMIMADPDSMSHNSQDIGVRFRTAAKLAGINDEKVLKDIELQRNKKVKQVMARYFVITHNLEFEAWISILTAYNTFTAQLRSPSFDSEDPLKDIKVKQEITLKLLEYLKTIRLMERKLFKDDFLKKAVLEEEAFSRKIHYAEMFADDAETI